MDGILPADVGGTTYAIGDAYMYEGKWYVKLGSGLEGAPELPAGVAPILGFIFSGFVVLLRRNR